jgi:lysyl-tRNA synthetase class II
VYRTISKLTIQQYKELRQVQIAKLKEGGIDPFPHKFATTHSLAAFRETFNAIEKGKQLTDRVRVVGRVFNR